MSAITPPEDAAAVRSLVALCGDGHGRRALDLASGNGALALALAERGWAVSAVDEDAGTLTVAREAAAQRNLVVDWQLAPVDALPFDAGTFSAVTWLHAWDSEKVLAEIARCLQPEGLLATAGEALRLPAGTFVDVALSDGGTYALITARRR